MQHSTTDQLYIVVGHIPGNGTSGGAPAILINGLVAADLDIILFDTEVAVVFGGGGAYFGLLAEATGGFFDHGKGFRKDLFQGFLDLLVAFFFEFVYFLVNGIASVQVGRGECFGLLLFFGDLGIDVAQLFADAGAEFGGFTSELIVRQRLELLEEGIDLADQGLDLLYVFFGFAATEYFGKEA